MESTAECDSLCGYCSGINLEDLKSEYGYTHQPTFAALIDSSAACKLCNIMVHLLEWSFKQLLLFPRIDNMSAVSKQGPVRLIAASKEMDSQGIRVRPPGPVKAQGLSQAVAVVLGNVENKSWFFPGSAVLDMYSTKGSAADRLGVAVIQRIKEHAACESNFSRISDWLQNCRRNHATCSLDTLELLTRLRSDSGLPKRLIDADIADMSRVKLIETRGRREEYAALSYCWGKGDPLTTTHKSISRMYGGVYLNSLCQTIQDAVKVIRKLGIRYLWVDALCIIQGNEQDWQQEADRMGLIYANAYFTLAATPAESCEQGFLSARQSESVTLGFRTSRSSKTEGRIFFRRPSDFIDDYSEHVTRSPLLKRAWVKQERLLSRRTIDFSNKQIYWECRTAVWSEDGQTEHSDSGQQASEFMNCVQALSSGGYNDGAARLFFKIWANVISDYSKLDLTRANDKLPALQGLASLAGLAVPGQYLSGIWEINLADGLLWYPMQRPMARIGEWRAPSWSWASSKSPVECGGHDPQASRIVFRGISDDGKFRQILKLYGKIHLCYVSRRSQPPPKPCRSDRKLRERPVAQLSYAFTPDAEIFSTLPELDDSNTCRFDVERGDETEFVFLRLSCSDRMVFQHCQGLLLRRAGWQADDDVYQRVGIGWSSDPVWHEILDSEVCLI